MSYAITLNTDMLRGFYDHIGVDGQEDVFRKVESRRKWLKETVADELAAMTADDAFIQIGEVEPDDATAGIAYAERYNDGRWYTQVSSSLVPMFTGQSPWRHLSEFTVSVYAAPRYVAWGGQRFSLDFNDGAREIAFATDTRLANVDRYVLPPEIVKIRAIQWGMALVVPYGMTANQQVSRSLLDVLNSTAEITRQTVRAGKMQEQVK